MARDYEAEILYWTLIGLDSWGGDLLSKRPDTWWAKRIDDNRDCPPAYQYAHIGVAYDPAAWMKIDEAPPLNAAGRKAFSRAVEALEQAGLVLAIRRHGVRVSHLRPTALGLQVALRLAPHADLDALKRALQTAKWGTPEHIRAIDAAKEARP